MTRNRALTLLLTSFFLLGVFTSSGALAIDQVNGMVSKKKPVMLTANQVSYDAHSSVATATGKVVVVQGDTILLADKVTYDQTTDLVHATGHVSVMEPTGEVYFSDDAILKNDMQKGVVQQFRARLKDNSLFAAREARKVNKQITKMKDMVFSPCKVCQAQSAADSSSPLWQVEASKATVDEDAKRVRYQNAIMDIYGIPIIYTPYFSHPTPDAPNESGLLQPEYLHDSQLGTILKQPFYYTFAPNLDMTLTPWYMTNEHPMLEGEFRGITQNSTFLIRGAISDAYNRDDAGDVIPGEWTRGFLEAHAKIQLSQYWDAGLDAEHASDITFLEFYHFSSQDLLTSRLYAERIEDRNYFDVESLAFQGLQAVDQPSVSPYILPQANFHYETDPLAWHSRFMMDSNMLVLTRDEGDQDQRFSTTATWKLPYITRSGQVFELNTSLRGDLYHVTDQLTDSATGATFNGDTGRVIPQVDLNWRYPFINRFGEGRSLMVAPVVELTASPNMHATSNIPNEDSQVAELSDINLFSPDRFAGLDQVESGLRGTYGTRGQFQWTDKKYIEWLFGQTYQQNENSPFPITTTQMAHASDYIGRLALKYDSFNIAYSFRLDRDTFSPTSNEVETVYVQKPVTFDITYIALQNEPLFGDRKEVFGSASFDLAPNWALNFGGRRDLGSSSEEAINTSLPVSALNPLEPTDGTVGINMGLVFHNECISITSLVSRSYISQEDVKPSTTFGVTVLLKNFGAPVTPAALSGTGNMTSINTAENPVNPALPASGTLGLPATGILPFGSATGNTTENMNGSRN